VLRLAWLNLTQNKTRLLFSTGGVGLALTLVLFFDAVFAGATSRLTVYIDRAGADIWVSQQGVRAMHMSASAIPAEVTEQVRSVPGIQEAVPILYATEMIAANGKEHIAYVFGLPDDATLGRPWGIVEGRSSLAPGEIIIDRSVARASGIGPGDRVAVLGRDFEVAGLTSGTATMVSSVAFVGMEDFARSRGHGEVISFVLATVEPGASEEAVRGRVQESVSGVTVQTSDEFARQERELAKDMSADIIGIMNTAGFLTGFAVVALTVYIATIARRREYGVLKAMGARNRLLYGVVVIQALLAVAMGLAAGIGVTLLLSEIIPRLEETLLLTVSLSSLARVALVSVFIAGAAALLPARQIAGLEPVSVIRRG
jgi:putative ABC transport system permease protein